MFASTCLPDHVSSSNIHKSNPIIQFHTCKFSLVFHWYSSIVEPFASCSYFMWEKSFNFSMCQVSVKEYRKNCTIKSEINNLPAPLQCNGGQNLPTHKPENHNQLLEQRQSLLTDRLWSELEYITSCLIIDYRGKEWSLGSFMCVGIY